MSNAPGRAGRMMAVAIAVLSATSLLLACASTPGSSGSTPSPATEPTQAAAPSPSPAPDDTSDWVAYSSERYGYDIAHPSDWPTYPSSKHASSADWTEGNDVEGADGFTEPERSTLVRAFAVPIPAGMSKDDWITAYRGPSADGTPNRCPAQQVDLGPVMVDGHDVTLMQLGERCHAIHALVFVDDRAYDFLADGSNQEAVLKAFLSTVRFQPEAVAALASSASLPPSGDLKPGTYTIERTTWGGRPGIGGSVMVTLPAGWTGDGGAAIVKSVVGTSQGMRLSLGTLAGIALDPCLWVSGTLDQKEHSHLKAEAEALATQPGRTGPLPSAVAIAAWHGYRVELTTPVDTTSCEGGRFRSWTVPDRHDVYQWPGQIDLLWLVDTDREMFYIDASYFPTTSAEDRSEIVRIVESIRFIW